MNKSNLLIVVPDLGPGGGIPMNLRLAHELQRRGWRVKVAALFDRWRIVSEELCSGLDIVILGKSTPWNKIQLPWKIARLAKRSDIVLGGAECSATTYGFAGSNLAGKPFVGWHHIAFHRCRQDMHPLHVKVIQGVHRRVRWLVFPSNGARESLQQALGNQPEGTVWQVIENFQPSNHLSIAKNPPDALVFSKPVVLGIGRLAKQKAFDRLIRAHAVLRRNGFDHHLVILGEGPLRQKLEREIQHLEVADSAFLLGHVDNVMDWLSHATVFALCSRYEGFGLVLLEALSCGVPSVAMDCPAGPREILRDGEAGLLVPDGDEADFQEAIARLLTSPELRKHYAERGRERAKYYSPERIIPKWEALLEQVMASS